MGIQYIEARAVFEGCASVEEAESLWQHLRSRSDASIDMAACEHVHAAVLQVLLALQPRVDTPPMDPWLRHTLASLPGPSTPEEGKPCQA